MIPRGPFRIMTLDAQEFVFSPHRADGTRNLWFNGQPFGLVEIVGCGVKHSEGHEISYPGEIVPEYQLVMKVLSTNRLWFSSLIAQVYEPQDA